MKNERIRFLRRYEVQAVDGPVYEKGQVVTKNAAACEHFVRRGAAEYYTAEMEKAEKAAAAEEKARKEAEAKAKKEADDKAKKDAEAKDKADKGKKDS